eukprot:4113478-Pleurochrysis_carterae.AAC.1
MRACVRGCVRARACVRVCARVRACERARVHFVSARPRACCLAAVAATRWRTQGFRRGGRGAQRIIVAVSFTITMSITITNISTVTSTITNISTVTSTITNI